MSKLLPNPYGPKGWTPERLSSLKGKTYLVTGANVGAGFEATKVLVSKEAKVVMLCRNPGKAASAIEAIKQQYPVAELSFIQLDLASLESVRSAADAIKRDIPKIDALICNAAIAQVAKQEMTIDGFESQLGVNHYGHFLLCGLLFDRVNESAGRIVVVGSMGYNMGLKTIQFDDLNFDHNYNPMNSYSHSKLAQMVFAYELQHRVREAGLKMQVHVCHPGAARTTLSQEEANLPTRILFKLLSPLAQSAERGSWPEVLCATEDHLEPYAFYGPTKRAQMVGPVGKCILMPHALDREMANRLWAVSEQKTGISWSP
ncbi:SDR family oxidoreductase [Ferrimonas kyonanensis]|uniref:SDR family oxidoreductase n=1 Tax=Ferrimonas kyonanensis TaxID=364763 RepID=UPI00048549D2|nr:SDR family oxidoreductase [Ferrimonas kyonanensis]